MTIYSNTPYTYRIKWTSTGMNYYGVRYATDCHPDDLFVTYFTSSKYVAEYIKQNGLPDVIEIRRVFTSESRVNDARAWEHRVLMKISAASNPVFLNRSTGKGIDPIVSAQARYGISPGNKGKPQPEFIKQKKKKPKETVACPHCGQTGGISAMRRHHFDNCGEGVNPTVCTKISETNKKKSQRPIVQEIMHLKSTVSQRRQRIIGGIIGMKQGWYQLPDEELCSILQQYKELICRP